MLAGNGRAAPQRRRCRHIELQHQDHGMDWSEFAGAKGVVQLERGPATTSKSLLVGDWSPDNGTRTNPASLEAAGNWPPCSCVRAVGDWGPGTRTNSAC